MKKRLLSSHLVKAPSPQDVFNRLECLLASAAFRALGFARAMDSCYVIGRGVTLSMTVASRSRRARFEGRRSRTASQLIRIVRIGW